jgi:chromosome segregation ATPase
MIEFRRTTKISGVQSEVDEVDEQILNLQQKREKLVLQIDKYETEITEIKSEITEHIEFVMKRMDKKTKPLFQVYKRTKKSKIGGRDYSYFEGRVRSRMRKGLLMKDKYYHIGDFNQSRMELKKVMGIELPRDVKEDVLKDHLKKLVERLWLEDLSNTNP